MNYNDKNFNYDKNFKKFQIFLKEYGFIFQGSLIYGGLANTWDYGPFGTIVKENIKNLWIEEFINKEKDIHLIDSKIIMNPKIWKSSGHIENFSDPLIENKVNKKRYRADKIAQPFITKLNIDHFNKHNSNNLKSGTKKIEGVEVIKNAEAMSNEELELFIKENIHFYDNCKTDWGKIKKFNLMFETTQGPIQDQGSKVFLRPEIAQGIFINFKNVQKSLRLKLPFGIAQIGKSFRNEITPSNFIFRTREFEQMEIEYFSKNEDENNKKFDYYINKCINFLEKIGIRNKNVENHGGKLYRPRPQEKDELAHYSKKTTDIFFYFPFGYDEIIGISDRGNFDLKNHELHSGENLKYFDAKTNEWISPYVVEPSIGLDRITLAVLWNSYKEENFKNNSSRTFLKLDQKIAPYKIAVLPLMQKFHNEEAIEVFDQIFKNKIKVFDIARSTKGSIGKRYRYQDAIGTPYVITIDDDYKDKEKITIRFRDSMRQMNFQKDKLDKIIALIKHNSLDKIVKIVKIVVLWKKYYQNGSINKKISEFINSIDNNGSKVLKIIDLIKSIIPIEIIDTIENNSLNEIDKITNILKKESQFETIDLIKNNFLDEIIKRTYDWKKMEENTINVSEQHIERNKK